MLIEPVMRVEIVHPKDYLGDVMGDLSVAARPHPVAVGPRGNRRSSGARAASEIFGYATDLRSLTQGRATYSMEFDRYEEVPRNECEKYRYGCRAESAGRSGSA